MSYYRFENTFKDLVDCKEALDNEDLPQTEQDWNCMKRLIRLCREISAEHGDRKFGSFEEGALK